MSDTERNVTTIKISGIDYGMIGYYRLDDVEKGVLKKWSKEQKKYKVIFNGSSKNITSISFIDKKNEGDIVFDTSRLIKVPQNNFSMSENDDIGFNVLQKRGGEYFFFEAYNPNYEINSIYYKAYAGVIIDEPKLIELQNKFKESDVLFFSGHHYGDNYNHDYCAPGFSNTLKMVCINKEVELYKAPAFNLSLLYYRPESIDDSEKTPMVYDNVKLIIAVGCKYIRRNVFSLYKRLFPNAVVVGYHCSAPIGDRDKGLLKNFFKYMDWKSLLEPNCNYKEQIVNAWKKSIEDKGSIGYLSKRLDPKPGYYYSLTSEEKVGALNDGLPNSKKMNLCDYYGKTIFNLCGSNADYVIPNKFETVPYAPSEKSIVQNVDAEHCVGVNNMFKHPENCYMIDSGLTYLVDEDYESEYYSKKKDEDEAEEHVECGDFPSDVNNVFKSNIDESLMLRENKTTLKTAAWHPIRPEGKVYYINTINFVKKPSAL